MYPKVYEIHITDPTPAPPLDGRGRGGVCNIFYFMALQIGHPNTETE